MNKILSKEFLKAHREQIIKAAAVLIILTVAFFVFTGKGDSGEEPQVQASDETVQEDGAQNETADDAAKDQTAASESQRIVVDVSGAVRQPSVIELESGSRVQDAIDAAGGLKKNADISNINRAAEVKDGEKIDIPVKGGSRTAAGQGTSGYSSSPGSTYASDQTASTGSGGGQININTADSSQLQTLTGIGPALAERIIQYREQNGGFAAIEDIKNVSGIGDKTFEKFRDSITV